MTKEKKCLKIANSDLYKKSGDVALFNHLKRNIWINGSFRRRPVDCGWLRQGGRFIKKAIVGRNRITLIHALSKNWNLRRMLWPNLAIEFSTIQHSTSLKTGITFFPAPLRHNSRTIDFEAKTDTGSSFGLHFWMQIRRKLRSQTKPECSKNSERSNRFYAMDYEFNCST